MVTPWGGWFRRGGGGYAAGSGGGSRDGRTRGIQPRWSWSVPDDPTRPRGYADPGETSTTPTRPHGYTNSGDPHPTPRLPGPSGGDLRESTFGHMAHSTPISNRRPGSKSELGALFADNSRLEFPRLQPAPPSPALPTSRCRRFATSGVVNLRHRPRLTERKVRRGLVAPREFRKLQENWQVFRPMGRTSFP